MKKPFKKSFLTLIVTVVAAATLIASYPVFAASPTKVNLLTTDSFAVLAGTAITNVPTSSITGNVGLSPAAGSNYSGLTAAQVNGTIYAVDGSGPAGSVNNPGLLTTAKNDLTTAYVDTMGRTPTTTFITGDNQLGGQTLTAGVYRFGNASTANLTAASPLTLDAQGDPNAVFIFQATSDLVTASGSVVQLTNGAQACNIFWQVGSSATLGSSSTFKGTLMTLTAASVNSSATIEGRILAQNAAVTLNANTITRPATCLTSSTGGPSEGSGTGASNGNGTTVVPGLPNTSNQSTHTSTVGFSLLLIITVVSSGALLYILRSKRIR
jgi:hypothetical protein